MRKLPIAYELYGMRGDMERSVEGTLKKVRELGFDGVEFAGFFGKSATEIKSLAADAGLVPISSHVPLRLIQGSPEATIAYHQELGCRNIVVPYLEEDSRPGAPGFAKVLGLMTRFGMQCRNAGLRLLYHNHDFEFRQVSGIYGLDFIFQAVPEELLATEIDTCWVKYAGVDPVSYLASYKGRAPLVHIKDFVSTNPGRTPYALIGQDAGAPDHTGFAYRPFGHGSQDAPALLQAAVDAGAEWLILEQDEPSGESPYADARMSMETFASLGY
jgi:sugar phosphate isomerase/epimerase